MESNEILAVVDSVSTEKGLEKDIIFNFKDLQILVDKNSIEYIDQAELDLSLIHI